MHILGLDPGKTGGSWLLGAQGNTLAWKTWRSIEEMFAALNGYRYLVDLVIGMERPQAFEEATKASTFTFGFNVGAQYGFVRSFGCPVYLITPNMWTDRMHATHISQAKGNPKQVSYEVSERLFPEVHAKWRADNAHLTKCPKFPDGPIDAGLIAEYTRAHILNPLAKESMARYSKASAIGG